jgi:hypothetical protein
MAPQITHVAASCHVASNDCFSAGAREGGREGARCGREVRRKLSVSAVVCKGFRKTRDQG